MYTAVLVLHSLLRWSALIAGVGATFMAFNDRGDVSRRPASARADRWGLALIVALDLQLLVGLTLYLGLSPYTIEAMSNFSAAMADPGLRYFAVEHPAMMIAAIALAHVGRVLARKAPTPAVKRARLMVCFGLSTVLMIAGTPWPGLPNGRPLLPVS